MGIVFGIGVYEKGTYFASKDNKRTREYSRWCNMLERCYSKRALTINPTYEGCSTSKNFKNFQYFAEWCNRQKGFQEKDWHLDKDILGCGKLYSEDNCAFIPSSLNLLFTDGKAIRGLYPIGVTWCKKSNKFLSHASVGGEFSKHLGRFDTAEGAHRAYVVAKEEHVRQQAERWAGMIDVRVYEKLLTWKCEVSK